MSFDCSCIDIICNSYGFEIAYWQVQVGCNGCCMNSGKKVTFILEPVSVCNTGIHHGFGRHA